MRHKAARDGWRVKLSATWVLLAPVFAMALVVVLGTTAAPGQFVVGGGALDTGLLVRPDAIFDDLVKDVPDLPGANGRLGSEDASTVQIPVTGSTDGSINLPHVNGDQVNGIPNSMLLAYQRAATDLGVTKPSCGLTWPLLAGIGKVESSHASGGRVDPTGTTRGQILGPVLDGGPGMAAISDTDQGLYDGNTVWDRAVGPMQFIPGTWKAFGADGNADGVRSPHNVYDAARAAGEYLCHGGANLRDPRGLVQAVLRYNHSMSYVSTVLGWMQTYSRSGVITDDRDGDILPGRDDEGNVDRDEDNPNDDDQNPTTTTTTTTSTATTSRPAATTRPPSTTRPPTTTRPTTAPTKPSSKPTTKPTPTIHTVTPTKPSKPTPPTPTPTCPTPTPGQTQTPTPTPGDPCAPTPTPTPPGQTPPGPAATQHDGQQQPSGTTSGTAPTATATSLSTGVLGVTWGLVALATLAGLIAFLATFLGYRRRQTAS